MTAQSIINAAALISDIDPVLARAFIEQPLQRHNLVTAFWKSLQGTSFQKLADNIAVALRSAIDGEAPATSPDASAKAQKSAASKTKTREIFIGGKRNLYTAGKFDAVSFELISDAGWIQITSIGSENIYFNFTTDAGEVLPGYCKCL
jgi:hypothetical protein